MTTKPDKCPRCGAVVVGDYHLFLIGGEDFVCGTIIVRQGDRRVEARRLAHRILTTVQTTETLQDRSERRPEPEGATVGEGGGGVAGAGTVVFEE